MLFSTEMVKALLYGSKSMTRRIVKHQPIDNTEVDGNFYTGNHTGFVKVDGHQNWRETFALLYARYSIGDIIWVREKFQLVTPFGPEDYLFGYADNQFSNNKASKKYDYSSPYEWKPSIHMPKEACRIFLEITSIRVERLNDISEDDSKKEGAPEHLKVDDMKLLKGLGEYTIPRPFRQYQFGFLSIWCRINGCESWLNNPWVWVIEFKKVAKPINFI